MIKRCLIVMAILLGVVVLGQERVSAENWADFDVRTELSEGITEDKIKSEFKRTGKSHSPLYDKIGFIMDETKKVGINPVYLIAKMNYESNWGLSSLALNKNNFGGIGGSKPVTFESVEAGILANIKAITRYVNGEVVTSTLKKGTKVTTAGGILEEYCPTSDGCEHSGYLRSVGDMMSKMGQEFKGGKMETKEMSSESSDKIRDEKGVVIPGEAIYVEGGIAVGYHVGVDKGEGIINQSQSYWLYKFSKGTLKWMYMAGALMSAILIGYMSIYIVGYLVIARGSRLDKFLPEKVLENGREVAAYGIKGATKIVWRMVLALVVLSLFLSGLYIDILAIIFGVITQIVFQ